MKSELIRIQSSTRETSVSFLRHKSETETQLAKLQTAIATSATTCACTCSKTPSVSDAVVPDDTTLIADLTTNGC